MSERPASCAGTEPGTLAPCVLPEGHAGPCIFRPGPTGRRVHEPIRSDDQGETAIAVYADPRTNVVMVRLGVPTSWLGLPKAHALALAELLRRHAETLP